MKDIIIIVISVLGTLSGAYLGGSYTRKSQLDLFKHQKEEEDRKINKKREEERMKVYIEVLKMNGQLYLIENAGGNHGTFNADHYEEYMRSTLYNNFHLLHQNVARTIGNIDACLSKCDFHEEITSEDHAFLCNLYSKLLKQIEAHIDEYRKNIFD